MELGVRSFLMAHVIIITTLGGRPHHFSFPVELTETGKVTKLPRIPQLDGANTWSRRASRPSHWIFQFGPKARTISNLCIFVFPTPACLVPALQISVDFGRLKSQTWPRLCSPHPAGPGNGCRSWQTRALGGRRTFPFPVPSHGERNFACGSGLRCLLNAFLHLKQVLVNVSPPASLPARSSAAGEQLTTSGSQTSLLKSLPTLCCAPCSLSRSVASDSLQPHELGPTRLLLCPWGI